MNISIKPSALLSVIAATNHAGRIGIVGQSGRLAILSGDGYRMTQVQAGDCTVDGSFLVWIDAASLVSALRASYDAEKGSLTIDYTSVAYSCGRVVMKTPVAITAQDWERLPEPDKDCPSVVVIGSRLANAIELARAIPKKVEGSDDWRNSVGITASDFGCDIDATDGKRIVHVSLEIESCNGGLSAAVQPKLLSGMPAIDGCVVVKAWGSWIGFYGDHISFVVRRLESDFPTMVQDALRKMEDGCTTQLANKDSILGASRTLASLCEDHHSATLKTESGSCVLSLTTQSGDIALPVEGEWALEKVVKLPPSQIVQFLSRVESKTVEIGIKDDRMPVTFHADCDGASYTLAVAPCR